MSSCDIVLGIKPLKGQRVWRVEVRFGKEAIANRLHIRTFQAVEAKLAKTIKDHMLRTRYTLSPRDEQNPSRMDIAPFWQACIDATDKCFEFETSEELQITVRERLLELKKEVYKGLVTGNIISYASLEVLNFDEVLECLDELIKDIHKELSLDSGKYEKRFNKALEKHSLL